MAHLLILSIMNLNIKKYLHLLAVVLLLGGAMPVLNSCADDDMSKSLPDYDPRYKGKIAFGTSDYNVDANEQDVTINFKSDQKWSATVETDTVAGTGWATLATDSGTVNDSVLVVHLQANESETNSRKATVTITTEKGTAQAFTIGQNYKVVILDPNDIPDYAKYICPAASNPHFENGADYMLRQDSYYSWHRMKQSEHFFVFWSPEFGDDPNGDDVKESMRVDVDDLLAKAEHFFDTNVNKLGMAKLGEGKSMLDDYKMQIYLIYQDEWLATGSGYDNKIGALWVNPSTCKPVGSTIAHEIGHSFQYQVYADKINKQGYPDDLHHGFRYGFGANGEGGCAYWEQCAQWQAHLDYPQEAFSDWFSVWKENCHRHFNHQFMRYASDFLPYFLIQAQGNDIDVFGRLWRDSQYPQDPLEAYDSIYYNKDLNKLYKDLYTYASHMVYYDIPWVYSSNASAPVVPEEAKGNYSTTLYKVGDQKYQVGYASCPGTTGFNVIQLKTPAAGTKVSVDIEALEPGSALVKADKGEVKDADGKVVKTTKTYNEQTNKSSNYRCGYVAIVGGKPVYSTMYYPAKGGVGDLGSAEYTVPAGTEKLYFVIQAAPDEYHRCAWNSDEGNDEQWPYAITVKGTDVNSYEEVVDINIDPNSKPSDASVTINVHGNKDSGYEFAKYNLAYVDNAAIPYAFCLMPNEITNALVTSATELTEGKISMRLKQPDGSYATQDNCGGQFAGFWCDATGKQQSWGTDARTYTKFNSINELEVGFMPGVIKSGETYPEVLELRYMKDGKIYTVTINVNFIVE